MLFKKLCCAAFLHLSLVILSYSMYFSCLVMIFFIPSSISVASLHPYIGDLSIALIALLFDILYLSYIGLSSFSGVHIKPYYTYAYIAPTIKFLLIFGVTPPPLNINGISNAFSFSALFSYVLRCWLCDRLCSIIFPKYL